MNTRQIHELLHTLGIGRHYLGHNITVHAIQIILGDKDSLLHVKNEILYQSLNSTSVIGVLSSAISALSFIGRGSSIAP